MRPLRTLFRAVVYVLIFFGLTRGIISGPLGNPTAGFRINDWAAAGSRKEQ